MELSAIFARACRILIDAPVSQFERYLKAMIIFVFRGMIRGTCQIEGLKAAMIYRPFLLAKQGEFKALSQLSPQQKAGMTPVFLVAPREEDWDNGGYLKTIEAHLSQIPEKVERFWGKLPSFVDVTLLDSEPLINGLHPLAWLTKELNGRGVPAVPIARPDQSAELHKAVTEDHALHGRGAGIALDPASWSTVNPAALHGLLSLLGIPASEVDVFIDFEDNAGIIIESAVENEIHSLAGQGFRSISIGGSAFPSVSGTSRGISEIPRTDWITYKKVDGSLRAKSVALVDYFDHLVVDIQNVELLVPPRVLSISGTFRYAVDEEWLFAKGELYKGANGRGIGGKSLLPALNALQRHPKYGSPIHSQTDAWIADVVANSATPGNPTTWREWASLRHLEVTLHQLANLP